VQVHTSLPVKSFGWMVARASARGLKGIVNWA